MPIYEYRCRECGEKFEKLVLRARDAETIECPRCGQRASEQLYSTFATTGGGTASRAGAACGPSAGGFS